MLVDNNIGTRMNWKDAVNKYPNKWLAFNDCIFDHNTFISGLLNAILEDEEVIQYEIEHNTPDLYLTRTSSSLNSGVLK